MTTSASIFNLPRDLHGGMERAYRYDALSKQMVQLYISNRATGSALAPFATCATSWDVTGRFEKDAP